MDSVTKEGGIIEPELRSGLAPKVPLGRDTSVHWAEPCTLHRGLIDGAVRWLERDV